MSSVFQYPHAPIYGPTASPQDKRPTSADYPYMGVHTIDDVQRYVLGTRYIMWDGRAFRYAKAGGTMDTAIGCWSQYYQALVQWPQFPSNHAIGDNPITITTSADDGIAYGGVFAEDALSGGNIALWPTGGGSRQYGIVGNDAVASAGAMNIYLDAPLDYTITAGAGSAEGVFSPWFQVYNVSGANSGGNRPHVGVPIAVATTTYPYHWVQTWGVIHVSTAVGQVGAGDSIWEVYFAPNGSLQSGSSDAFQQYQRAGFTIAVDYDGGAISQASPFIFLQITP